MIRIGDVDPAAALLADGIHRWNNNRVSIA